MLSPVQRVSCPANALDRDSRSCRGSRLNDASEAYNRAVRSYQARLLTHARAFGELGIGVSDGDHKAVEESVEAIRVTPPQIALSQDGEGFVETEANRRAAHAETATDETGG